MNFKVKDKLTNRVFREEPTPDPSLGEMINNLGEVFAKAVESHVDSPSHYTGGEIECIDALEAMLTPEEFIGYLRGACFKYQWRCRCKGETVQDLEKNKWYLDRLVKILEVDND